MLVITSKMSKLHSATFYRGGHTDDQLKIMSVVSAPDFDTFYAGVALTEN